MYITEISIENYCGVKRLKLKDLTRITRITGENGAGKSTILHAIKEALKSSGVDPELITGGKDRSEILLRIDDRILVERRITRSTNNVKVVVDGEPISSPQKFLNELVGPFTFNPVDFFLAKDPKAMTQMVLSALPFTLDMTALTKELGDLLVDDIDLGRFNYDRHGLEVLDQVRQEVYERRHECNLERTRIDKALEQDRRDIPETFNPERFAAFDLSAKVEELSQAKVALSNHANKEREIAGLRNRLVQIESEQKDIQRKIEEAEARLLQLDQEHDDVKAKGKALVAEVETFTAPDTASLETEISEFKESQKLIHKVEEIKRREQSLVAVTERHASLDRLHKALVTDIPKKMLGQLHLPIEGLEFDGGTLRVKGVHIQKLSDGEKLEFACDYARMTLGDLRAICVDGFEKLDPKRQEEFEVKTKGDGVEYFITVVSRGELNVEKVA